MGKRKGYLKGFPAAVVSPEGDAVDVSIQSSTNDLFQYLLMRELKTDIVLTQPIAVDDEEVHVSSGHGFVGITTSPGENIVVRNGDVYFQLEVKSVTADIITLAEPSVKAFPVAGTSVIRGNVLLSIDGSAGIDFKFGFNDDLTAVTPIDLQFVVLVFQSGATEPDDGTFGGLPALVNGMLLRKRNHEIVSFGNYKTNKDFRDVGGEIDYTSKAPSGSYGTVVTIDIERKFGQVKRIDPRTGDYVFARLRDTLGALDLFTIALLGSYTSGE